MSSDFPLTAGGALTSPATGISDPRPFLVRLDSSGIVTLSTIFGAQGSASAVAIAADGVPYLIKLNPTTPKILFSATGIGKSSIALDTAGNIFVSRVDRVSNQLPDHSRRLPDAVQL